MTDEPLRLSIPTDKANDYFGEKTQIERCLERWNVSEREYLDRGHKELFSIVVRYVCKSPNISKSPDSAITIFRRENKWGFALSVWTNMGLGESWLPVVQATVFTSQDDAFLAGQDMFIRMAKSDMLKSNRLVSWAKELTPSEPHQMSLF